MEGRGQEAELWVVKLNQTEMCNESVGDVFSHSSKTTCRVKNKIDAFSISLSLSFFIHTHHTHKHKSVYMLESQCVRNIIFY